MSTSIAIVPGTAWYQEGQALQGTTRSVCIHDPAILEQGRTVRHLALRNGPVVIQRYTRGGPPCLQAVSPLWLNPDLLDTGSASFCNNARSYFVADW